MKPIPTLLFLTLFVTFCSAQDWKPYVSNANCIYGSGQNGKKHLISVRYDSVYTSGTTTLVFAYTRSYPGDSCLNAAHRVYRFDPLVAYPHERVYPFPIDIRQNEDSIVSANYTILTHAQKGSKWDDYTYEEDSVMLIFGIADSVKIYAHAYEGRIILSKHFGIVRLYGYTLMGFRTDSVALGLHIPSVETTFKLAAGDILYYRTIKDTMTSPYPGREHLYADSRDSVTAVTVTPDTISIHFIRQEQNYFYPSQSFSQKSVVYKHPVRELDRLFQDGAPITAYYRSCFYTKSNVIMHTSIDDTVYSVDLYHNGFFYNCRFQPMYDLCAGESFASDIVVHGTMHCGAIYGGSTLTTLIGSRIGNKVNGHINLSVQNPGGASDRLTVYPNPASDMLNLSKNAEVWYVIIDASGYKQTEGETDQTISLQSVPPGLYTLIVSTPEGIKTFRIVKN